MSDIHHHIPDDLLCDYVAGRLNHVFAVVVAAHVSLCDDCRARAEAEEALAGVVLEGLDPAPLSDQSRDRIMARLDGPDPTPRSPRGSGIFPAPVMEALKQQPPRWKMLGGGIRQQILAADSEGSLRLLYIPPGRAVPEHGHRGLELTLVLQGSFADSEGTFGVGDVEVAATETDHQPVAGPGRPCICLAATDAPLRFHAMIPRLLQPIFRI